MPIPRESSGPRTVVALRHELIRCEQHGYTVQYVERLIDTFPWWKRAMSWFLWRGPFRNRLARHFVNPYVGLVATILPPSDSLSRSEQDGTTRRERDGGV